MRLFKANTPTGKMNVFGTIFKVNSSLGKLRDLLGHFDKIPVFFIKQFYKIVRSLNNCLIFAQTV